MWHEARKQERKLRGMMVDYKRRAERRREYYEKIKLDPTQFIRLHGRPCKINLDPSVAMAAEGPGTMMPWQGDTTNLIDRFDVRAHLDYIPEYKPSPFQEPDVEEKKCNYERYRTLVQNEFTGMTEEQVLYQIHLDDLYGAEKKKNEEKERLAKERASIGFVYEDSTSAIEDQGGGNGKDANNGDQDQDDEDDDDDDHDEIDSDIDIDVDLDVDSLTEEQTSEVNSFGVNYGMDPSEYVRQLKKDKEEIEALRRAREEEEEKAMYSGRKSRRERRALIEKRLKGRKISPPSYARRDSPTYQPYRHSASKSSSRSRSRTPENVGKMEFITSFGDEEEEAKTSAAVIGPVNRPQSKQHQERVSDSRHKSRRRRDSSSSSSSSRSSSSGSSYSSRSRSRSRSRGRYRRYSRSRSRDSRDRYSHHQRDRYNYPRRPYRRSSRSRSGDRYRRSRSPIRRYSRHYSSSSSSRSRSRSRDRYEHSRSHNQYHRERSDRRYDDSGGRSSRDQDTPLKKKEDVTAKLKVSESSVGKASNVSASVNASAATKPKLTPQERLKKRMQLALNKQHKADKKKEQLKTVEKEQERMERDDELREIARKIRRREREKRDQEDEFIVHRSRSRSPSPKRGWTSDRHPRDVTPRRRYRSRSRSRTPPRYRY
ncbi:CLK4-associating serine/arginine rich protein-like [Ptychodera flava]|uniref:CLK4-associating serine/arginine rich protein-like n=1 Tax=Ptychodera flava TaxID=63121 RepID=UPI00396AA211